MALKNDSKEHRFGGDWTETKLAILQKYLAAYTTALKRTPFRKAYIDAFAGTGYRNHRRAGDPSQLELPDHAEEAPQRLLDGSARLALKVEPPFDSYVFIERNAERCAALRSLSEEFPDRADRIRVQEGEANTEIRAICAKNWKAHRAVLFLDPYGMQVEWSTIESVARTKAIDLWLLFPLGIGVNRLVTRSGEIPDGWKRRLDLLLGTSDWFEAFYEVEQTGGLFGPMETVTKRSIDVIAPYFEQRLRSVFPAVATPGVLRNSANCPLYLLCFAASNERGAKPALSIANHLLKDIR